MAVARDIFGRQDFITYVDLAEQIQAILDVKERTAKKLYQVHAGEGNHTERPVEPELLYHRKFKTGRLMIPLDKETFEAYMERLLEQVEKVVGALDKKNKKPQKLPERGTVVRQPGRLPVAEHQQTDVATV